MPGETLKGTIKLYPGIKLKIKDNKLHLKLKFYQYEFWEYTNIKINELKNVYKTDLASYNFEYILKEEEQQNFEENAKFENFSIVLIEKEEEEKIISIPFEFKIDENNTKLLPTFQFETDKYILGIRHLLTVECEEYNSINYIGLFIGKQKDNNFIESKKINDNYKTLFDDIDIQIHFPKQSFYFGEKVIFRLKSNSKYTFNNRYFEQILYRKIEWIGYIKNSLIDKRIFKKEGKSDIKYDKDIYDDNELDIIGDFLDFISYPLIGEISGGGAGGILGTIGGGLILSGSNVLIGALFGGFVTGVVGMIGGGIAGIDVYNFSPGQTKFSNIFISEAYKGNDDINDKIKEELKKFVYFKDNKIIGFIKFRGNIAPPINGHYFKCNFNLKITTKIPGLVSNDTKFIKTKIDFYDGQEYIEKMKKLLSLNS